jgi:hypothetical protein
MYLATCSSSALIPPVSFLKLFEYLTSTYFIDVSPTNCSHVTMHIYFRQTNKLKILSVRHALQLTLHLDNQECLVYNVQEQQSKHDIELQQVHFEIGIFLFFYHTSDWNLPINSTLSINDMKLTSNRIYFLNKVNTKLVILVWTVLNSIHSFNKINHRIRVFLIDIFSKLPYLLYK